MTQTPAIVLRENLANAPPKQQNPNPFDRLRLYFANLQPAICRRCLPRQLSLVPYRPRSPEPQETRQDWDRFLLPFQRASLDVRTHPRLDKPSRGV